MTDKLNRIVLGREVVEPEWVEITSICSHWEERFDVRADPTASDAVRYSYRPRMFSGQRNMPWVPGRAPK